MHQADLSEDFPFKLWQRLESSPAFLSKGEHSSSHELIDCVVVAAGIGTRMKTDRPKQYLSLGGHTVLEWTVCQILQSPSVGKVILVLHPQDQYFAQTCLASDPLIKQRIVTVTGGKERVDSVCCGLHAVTTPWCMVHDAARPFIHIADIERLVEKTLQAYSQTVDGKAKYTLSEVKTEDRTDVSTQDSQGSKYQIQGGILAIPETDTLKRKFTSDFNGNGVIAHTEDRSTIYRAQTPQLFRTDYLLNAILSLQKQGKLITDEASVVDFIEADSALLVNGSPMNFKLTTPADMVLAQSLVDFYRS